MIVDHEVTKIVNDHGLPSEMAIRAKEALGVQELELLTDLGYRDGAEVKRCIGHGITPFIPKVNVSTNSNLGLYGKPDFKYLPKEDAYLCPAGEKLTNTGERQENRRLRKFYSIRACRECVQKSLCTRSRQSRRIFRWAFEEVFEKMDQRVKEQPEKTTLRRSLAEHPFGTIKHHWYHGHFLMKRLPNVRTEMSLSMLAYDLRRAINAVGMNILLEALA
jgi:transposase